MGLYVAGTSANILKMLLTILLASIEAPIMTLFLSAYADNRVEGLALSKLMGFFLAAPVIAYFVEARWQYLIGIFLLTGLLNCIYH